MRAIRRSGFITTRCLAPPGSGSSSTARSLRPGGKADNRSVQGSGKEAGQGSGGKEGQGSGTGPILLSQATFLLAHIANSGPVPLSAPADLCPVFIGFAGHGGCLSFAADPLVARSGLSTQP